MRHGAASWRSLALIALAGVAPVTAVVPAAPGILNILGVHLRRLLLDDGPPLAGATACYSDYYSDDAFGGSD